MRTRVLLLCAALAVVVGCGGAPTEPKPLTPDEERAYEQQQKDEAAREAKARQLNKKKGKDAADRD
jgi:hypothetical protein